MGKSRIGGKLTGAQATVLVAIATVMVAAATCAPLDKIVSFFHNEPAFHNGNEPARPLAVPVLAGTVLDAKDETPIEGAALTVVVNNKVMKTEHSDSGGGFRILLPGLRSEEQLHLIVVKERYVSQDRPYAPPVEGVAVRLVRQ